MRVGRNSAARWKGKLRRDVSRVDTEEKRGHEPGEKQGRHDSERDAESGPFRAISKDETTQISARMLARQCV